MFPICSAILKLDELCTVQAEFAAFFVVPAAFWSRSSANKELSRPIGGWTGLGTRSKLWVIHAFRAQMLWTCLCIRSRAEKCSLSILWVTPLFDIECGGWCSPMLSKRCLQCCFRSNGPGKHSSHESAMHSYLTDEYILWHSTRLLLTWAKKDIASAKMMLFSALAFFLEHPPNM